MLEKIGLPAKPSLRGNNWVVDASHCQGCASPFTFINRKHHCRRCGGLFCNNCTLHRMLLRGQGDSPVRICEPCKKLVEAERFELRHGHRSKAGQGRSKMVSNVPDSQDEILTQILGSDARTSSFTKADTTNMDSTESTASGSSNLEDACMEGGSDLGSFSPEDLRRQALDEKKRYKILKGEGKPEEALRAFKKGKELERQADALELSLRKGRRKTLHPIQMENIEPDPSENTRVSSKRKDDLLLELRELGWSDQDLHSADRKPEAMSIEGELSTLIREINQKPSDGVTTQSMDRTSVTAHKRKALMLKREGKLAEAKEELKKAKLLEKQIEEQELLGGAEDSDDELSALMRSVDAYKEGELSVKQDRGFHVDDLIGDGDSMVVDGMFDVTDEDMQDPEMAATLKSLGWDEESHVSELSGQATLPGRKAPSNAFLEKEVFMGKRNAAVSAHVIESHVDQGLSSSTGGLPRRSKAEIQRELLSLKRKALALRRKGESEEAEEVLAAAKALEAQIADMEAQKTRSSVEVNASLERTVDAEDGDDINASLERTVDAEDGDDITENDLQDPSLLSMLKDLGWNEESKPGPVHDVAAKPSDRFRSTGENVVLFSSGGSTAAPRSKAKTRELLGLKRKALDLRRKGEIEEAEKVLFAAKELEAEIEEMESRKADDWYVRGRSDNLTPLDEQERHGDIDGATTITQQSAPKDQKLLIADWIGVGEVTGKHSADQGKLAGFSGSESVSTVDFLTGDVWSNTRVSNDRVDDKPSSVIPSSHPSTISNLQESKTNVDPFHGTEATRVDVSSSINADNATQWVVLAQSTTTSLEQEILAFKKKAVAFKREGKIAEAREELKRAKLLERSLEDNKPLLSPSVPSPTVPTDQSKEHEPVGSDAKPLLSSRERFKIQQESLAHKRQALKLRKEGRIKEAESELELAKALESRLEESAPHESGRPSSDSVVVEDLLDPELLSALQAIGIADTGSVISQERSGPSKTVSTNNSAQERSRLEEEIKAEKVKAVRLKRAGKQAEALDSLRQAKLLEKKLNSLGLD